MATPKDLVSASKGPYVQQTLTFLDSIFANYPPTDFSFRLWDGTIWQKPNADSARFTVVLNHPAALRRMFLPPSDTRMARAYTLGDFDIEGEAIRALSLGQHLWQTWGWRDLFYNAIQLVRLPSDSSTGDKHEAQLTGTVHSEDRDKKAIQFHYDVSNDFYKMWLDSRMVYSCGYFNSVTDNIDTAQFNKLDMICRKLRLKEGERLLDIGCGWGGLVIHAVQNYGVYAVGVTLSDKQVELARERVKQAGIADRCKIEMLDYRNVDESEPFDKIVSVGMIEHVGRQMLQTYFEKCYRLLRTGGVFLNHGITLLNDVFKSEREMKRGFFCKYIFPDGDIQPFLFVLERAAAAGWEIRDVESLREHYALTLNRWHTRLEQHEKEAVELMGSESYRLWKLYLLSAGWGFASGLHTIYQTLLYKTTDDVAPQLPLTRSDWYQ
ncbi:cyclopropane-fatty-acyl-phospholipid synthase [Gracilaria domingensis]|nr:cyclopropane-fatty-acyl-phospholipid synthase [Gracilaria domingensis]